jgi:6-pyruvoyltetrahydropterin/6-carboxytetrahydropterin synthase
MGYNGPCKNIHGHSYKLWVTISGEVDTKTGMILDFNDLKRIVYQTILSRFDHSLILYAEDNLLKVQNGFLSENLVVLPFNPTSENLIIHFSELIRKVLPPHINLHGLKLYETDTSFTEWLSREIINTEDINNSIPH